MFREPTLEESHSVQSEYSKVFVTFLGIFLFFAWATMVFVLFVHGKGDAMLASKALDSLNISGVENPVTAVLLNYRSYDTLMELAVLLIVALAMRPITCLPETEHKAFLIRRHNMDAELGLMLKILVPILVVVGIYLLWVGAYAPGGAFQAGAALAGAGVALLLAGSHRFNWQANAAPIALAIGLVIFILSAVITKFISGTVLQYPLQHAGSIILFIEVAATISITAILLLLFSQLKTMTNQQAENNL